MKTWKDENNGGEGSVYERSNYFDVKQNQKKNWPMHHKRSQYFCIYVGNSGKAQTHSEHGWRMENVCNPRGEEPSKSKLKGDKELCFFP